MLLKPPNQLGGFSIKNDEMSTKTTAFAAKETFKSVLIMVA